MDGDDRVQIFAFTNPACASYQYHEYVYLFVYVGTWIYTYMWVYKSDTHTHKTHTYIYARFKQEVLTCSVHIQTRQLSFIRMLSLILYNHES
jgi:hypothetical protein